jgi:hypothetical protein
MSGLQILNGVDVIAASLHNGLFLQDGRDATLPRLVRPQR